MIILWLQEQKWSIPTKIKQGRLVTADVVGLYPSITHETCLKALNEKLEEKVEKQIPSSDFVNMAKFVLKNNFSKLDSKVKKQIFGRAMGTKFAPPYTYIIMDKAERELPEAEDTKLWVWLRYIDNIFFTCAQRENKLEGSLKRLKTFHPNLKFAHGESKTVNFLDDVVSINNHKFETNLYHKPTACHQFLGFNSVHHIHIKKYIACSQGLHIKRLFAFTGICKTPFWFGKHGYPKKLVGNQCRRVAEKNPKKLLEHPIKPAHFVSLQSGFSLKNNLV